MNCVAAVVMGDVVIVVVVVDVDAVGVIVEIPVAEDSVDSPVGLSDPALKIPNAECDRTSLLLMGGEEAVAGTSWDAAGDVVV